ncbi:MAG: hypothetical protein JWO70_2801 [Betaproteobacteria bacterium]|nr:hypothetical protein [Betaproteobacteria bacterium]
MWCSQRECVCVAHSGCAGTMRDRRPENVVFVPTGTRHFPNLLIYNDFNLLAASQHTARLAEHPEFLYLWRPVVRW